MPLTQEDIDEISQMIYGSPDVEQSTGAPTDVDTGHWSADNWEWPYAPETLNPWLNDTVAGREFKSKIDSDEWKVGKGKEILGDMMEGHTYDEAVKLRGWSGFFPRIYEDIKQAGPELLELAKDPIRILTDPWDMMGQMLEADPGDQNIYEGGKTQLFQALEGMVGNTAARAALLLWTVPEGFVIGTATAAYNIARGEGDAGDVLDIATLFLGPVRAATVAKGMGGVAKASARMAIPNPNQLQRRVFRLAKEATASGKRIKIPKKLVQDMMDDPVYGPRLRLKYEELLESGKFTKRIETSAELVNLAVQNEELLLELLGYAGQRFTTTMIERYRSTGDIDAAVDDAVDDLSDESVEPPPEDVAPVEDTAPIEDTPPEESIEDEAVEEAPEEAPEEAVEEDPAEEDLEDEAPTDDEPPAEEQDAEEATTEKRVGTYYDLPLGDKFGLVGDTLERLGLNQFLTESIGFGGAPTTRIDNKAMERLGIGIQEHLKKHGRVDVKDVESIAENVFANDPRSDKPIKKGKAGPLPTDPAEAIDKMVSDGNTLDAILAEQQRARTEITNSWGDNPSPDIQTVLDQIGARITEVEKRMAEGGQASPAEEAFDEIANSITETANDQVHLPSEIDSFVDSQDIILEDETGSLINPDLANHPDYADIGTEGLISSIRESARQKIGEIVKTPLAFRKMAPAARDIERVEYTKSTKDGKSNYKYVYRNDEGRALASINVDQVSEDDIVVTVRTPGFKPVVVRLDRDSLGDAIPSQATETVIVMGGLPQTGLEQEHDIVDDKGRKITEIVLARSPKAYTDDSAHQQWARDLETEKGSGEMPADQGMFGTYWTIGNVETGQGGRHYTQQDFLDVFTKHIFFQDLDNFTVYARRQEAWHEARREGENVDPQEWSRVDRDFIEAEVRRYLEIQDSAESMLKQWEGEYNASEERDVLVLAATGVENSIEVLREFFEDGASTPDQVFQQVQETDATITMYQDFIGDWMTENLTDVDKTSSQVSLSLIGKTFSSIDSIVVDYYRMVESVSDPDSVSAIKDQVSSEVNKRINNIIKNLESVDILISEEYANQQLIEHKRNTLNEFWIRGDNPLTEDERERHFSEGHYKKTIADLLARSIGLGGPSTGLAAPRKQKSITNAESEKIALGMWETLKRRNTNWQAAEPADRTPFDNAEPVAGLGEQESRIVAKLGSLKMTAKTFVDKVFGTGEQGTGFQLNKIDPGLKVKAIYDENLDGFDVIIESDDSQIQSLLRESGFSQSGNALLATDISALGPREAAQSVLGSVFPEEFLDGINAEPDPKPADGSVVTNFDHVPSGTTEDTFQSSDAITAESELVEQIEQPESLREKDKGGLIVAKDAHKRESLPQNQDERIYNFENVPDLEIRATLLENGGYGVGFTYPRRSSGYFVVNGESHRDAINKAVELTYDDNFRWKPLYKPGVFASMDNLFNILQKKQLPYTQHTNRRIRGLFTNMRRGVNVGIEGHTIASLKELAIVGQVYRNSYMESNVAVFLDENRQIVATKRIHAGTVGQAGDFNVSELRTIKSATGAQFIASLHNHPHGNTKESDGDLSVHAHMSKTFGTDYLGSAIVDTGEATLLTREYDRKSGDYATRIRSRMFLTKEDLGWNVDDESYVGSGHRPDDPITRGRSESELFNVLGDTNMSLAKKSNLINAGHNMTTLIFKDLNNEVTNMVDYPDLHLLTSEELWDFIYTQALEFGGYRVDAFIGKGDWYEGVDDIASTGWGKVLSAEREGSHTLSLAWFDGIKEAVVDQGYRRMLPLYQSHVEYPLDIRAVGAQGYMTEQMTTDITNIPEGLLDVNGDSYNEAEKNIIANLKDKESVYGFLINDDHAISPVINSTGDSAIKKRLISISRLFSSFVINSQILSNKGFSHKLKTKDDVKDVIKMYNELDRRIVSDKSEGLPSHKYKDAFALARAANIQDNDRVMTIGDTHGVMATMARRENRNAHIETIGVNSFMADLYSKKLPGVVDRMDAIDFRNLSQQWNGKRPTVILLDGEALLSRKDIAAVDEALKILAPHGRLLVKSRMFTSSGRESWNSPLDMTPLGSSINPDIRHLAKKYRNVQHGLVGGEYYTIIDKVEPSYKNPANQKDYYGNHVGYFLESDFVEDERATRLPATADADAEYEGVSTDEQTFYQPVGNPIAPENISEVGGPADLVGVTPGPAAPSEPAQSTEDVSGVGADAGGLEPRGSELGIASQDTGVSGRAPVETEMADEMGGRDPVGSELREGDVGLGEDVDPEMESGIPDTQMSPLQGRDTQYGGEGTAVQMEERPADIGTGVSETVSGRPRTPSVSTTVTSNGIDKTTVQTPEMASPEAEVEGFQPFESGSLEQGKTKYAHILNFETAKKTLEKIGGAASDVLEDIKFIRNKGDIKSLRAKKNLENQAQRVKKHIHNYAKSHKINRADAARELSELLTAVHEGRHNGTIPLELQQVVDDIKNFNKESIESRMFGANKSILNHGRLFDMETENKQFLDNGLREELESPLNNFNTFAFKKKHRDGGHLRKFVRENTTGEIYGVINHGDSITLVNPSGKRIRNADLSILSNQHADYTTLIERGESRQSKQGGRRNQPWADVNGQTARQSGALASVQATWDHMMDHASRPDVLRKLFMDNGITLPDKVRFSRVKKIGNINHWAVMESGRRNKTLYMIKEILPTGREKIKNPDGSTSEQDVESHDFYNEWKNKLMIYDAKLTRDPSWILDETRPVKLWEPEDEYFPHIVDFDSIAKDPDSYAAAMVKVNPGLTQEQAMMWIKKRLHSGRTRRHGFLEQQRKYNLPDFSHNYFDAWEQYYAGALHRVEMIERWGQDEGLLTAKIQELYHSDEVMADMSDIEKGVLKLRQALGYNDFSPHTVVRNASMTQDKFYDSDGSPEPLDPSFLSTEEWRVLMDSDMVSYDNNTNDYIAKDRASLTNPIFLNGKLKNAERDAAIVSDIVVNQFGWRERDVFDSESEKFLVNARTAAGIVHLPLSWAAQISQSANTGLAFGFVPFTKAVIKVLTSKQARDVAEDMGVLAMDIAFDFGGGHFSAGEGKLQRTLSQELGSIPRSQIGEFHPIKSFLPTLKYQQDPGVKNIAWTPFYVMERFNRRTAGLAAQFYAETQIKKMLKNPESISTERERLISMPHAPGLEKELNRALDVKNLQPSDIDQLRYMTNEEVRETMPSLLPVHDFITEFGKEGSDWTQHRLEAIDRNRAWVRNPIFAMVFQFQSFIYAQQKFLKDLNRRDWRVMHDALSGDEGSVQENPKLRRLMSEGMANSSFLFRLLAWGFAGGVVGNVIKDVIRFREPDEDTFEFLSILQTAGMLGMVGDYIMMAVDWPGLEGRAVPPALSTPLSIMDDLVRGKGVKGKTKTLQRITRPPFGIQPAGPSFGDLNREEEQVSVLN